MDPQRAQEIAASPIMAEVTYQGDKIYIEQVDERNRTAMVHLVHEPENKQEVPLSSLVEQR